jgi:hypothetical protein
VLKIVGGNPVGTASMIILGLPSQGRARLAVFDVFGRSRAVLLDDHLRAGYHALRWTGEEPAGSNLGPGVYFLRLSTRQRVKLVKVVVAG